MWITSDRRWRRLTRSFPSFSLSFFEWPIEIPSPPHSLAGFRGRIVGRLTDRQKAAVLMVFWDCLWMIGLFYSKWSHWIRRSQLDKTVFALGRSPRELALGLLSLSWPSQPKFERTQPRSSYFKGFSCRNCTRILLSHPFWSKSFQDWIGKKFLSMKCGIECHLYQRAFFKYSKAETRKGSWWNKAFPCWIQFNHRSGRTDRLFGWLIGFLRETVRTFRYEIYGRKEGQTKKRFMTEEPAGMALPLFPSPVLRRWYGTGRILYGARVLSFTDATQQHLFNQVWIGLDSTLRPMSLTRGSKCCLLICLDELRLTLPITVQQGKNNKQITVTVLQRHKSSTQHFVDSISSLVMKLCRHAACNIRSIIIVESSLIWKREGGELFVVNRRRGGEREMGTEWTVT